MEQNPTDPPMIHDAPQRYSIIHFVVIAIITQETIYEIVNPAPDQKSGISDQARLCTKWSFQMRNHSDTSQCGPVARVPRHYTMRASGPRTQALHNAGQWPAHPDTAQCGPGARALRRCAMRARGPRTQALYDAGQWPAHPGPARCGPVARAPRPCTMRASGPRIQALYDAGQWPAHPDTARCGSVARALRHCTMRARGPRTQVNVWPETTIARVSSLPL